MLCARLPRPAEESHLGLSWSCCREITYLLIGNEGFSPAGYENAEVFYHARAHKYARAHARTHAHAPLIKCQNTGYANQFKAVYTARPLIQRGNRGARRRSIFDGATCRRLMKSAAPTNCKQKPAERPSERAGSETPFLDSASFVSGFFPRKAAVKSGTAGRQAHE